MHQSAWNGRAHRGALTRNNAEEVWGTLRMDVFRQAFTNDTTGCMNERRRPPRRGRGPRPAQPRPTFEANDMEVNPYQ